MNISIIGPGRIGGSLAKLWARAGHEVMLTYSRNQALLDARVKHFGARCHSGSLTEAMAFAEVVLLSPVFWQLDDVAARTDGLRGKLVIDVTNSYNPDWSPRPFANATSSAEENVRRFPAAKLVKAYNTLPYWFLTERLEQTNLPEIAVFYGGDEPEAKAVAATLIRDSGFVPIDAGGIADLHRVEMDSPVYAQGLSPEAARRHLAGVSPT